MNVMKTIQAAAPSPKLLPTLLRVGALAATILVGATGLAQAQPMAAGHGMMRGHGMAGGHMIGAILDAAGATADQRTKIQAIMKAAHDDLATQRQAARTAHQAVSQLLTAAQLDAAAIEAARQRVGALHEAASKRMTQALFDASSVLTAEQRQKVAGQLNMRRELMDRHQRERDALSPGRRS